MSKIYVDFIRGKVIESTHQVKALVTNINGKILLSTNNDNEFFFPRSSIKIFQAIKLRKIERLSPAYQLSFIALFFLFFLICLITR